MGKLVISKRVQLEVLDAAGTVMVRAGQLALKGELRDAVTAFTAGSAAVIYVQTGGERYEALGRVLDAAVPCIPGAVVWVELLSSGSSGADMQPFDLVPLTPLEHAQGGPLQAWTMPPPRLDDVTTFGAPRPAPPPAMSLAPEEAFPEEDEPTGVLGTLREMPVVELVQTLSQAGRDAMIEVKPRGGQPGVIGVERGRVVYAAQAQTFGEEAFYAMSQASRGAFRVRYGNKPPQQNIDCDLTFLLLEGARRADEAARDMAVTPSDAVPMLGAAALVDTDLEFDPRPLLQSAGVKRSGGAAGTGNAAIAPAMRALGAGSALRKDTGRRDGARKDAVRKEQVIPSGEDVIAQAQPATAVVPAATPSRPTPRPMRARAPSLAEPTDAFADEHPVADVRGIPLAAGPSSGSAAGSLPTVVTAPQTEAAAVPVALFARFFDEAGIRTPPPGVAGPSDEIARFASFRAQVADAFDDGELEESEITRRERRRRVEVASDSSPH